MDGKTLVTVLLSLLAGAAGGVGAHWVAGQTTTTTRAESDNTALLEALQRIESRLDVAERTGLKGSGKAATTPTEGASMEAILADDSDGGALAKLLARIDETVGNSVESKLHDMQESGDGLTIGIGGESLAKREVTFQELSQELELSTEEEEKLHAAMKATETAALKLLANEGEDLEDLRREIKDKAGTPEGKTELVSRFTSKLLTNMGGFIGLMVNHQASVKAAVGPEKAAKIDSNFEVKDPEFINFDFFQMD